MKYIVDYIYFLTASSVHTGEVRTGSADGAAAASTEGLELGLPPVLFAQLPAESKLLLIQVGHIFAYFCECIHTIYC